MEKIMTPVGRIPKEFLSEVKALAGFRWDENNELMILSERMKCKQVNPSEDRKGNEKGLIEMDAWIPARYMNFIFAKTLNDGLGKTIAFAKRYLFNGDYPVFLPAILSEKNPFLVEYLSYTKIMKLCQNSDKDNYSGALLVEYWNGGARSKDSGSGFKF